MGDSSSPSLQNPNPNPIPASSSTLPNPSSSLEDPQIPPPNPTSLPIPAVRVTSEFDSDSSIFLHKISCKFFDRLAKFKLSFQNNRNGNISDVRLGFVSKYLSVLYDLEDRNALVKGSFDVGPGLQFRAVQDVKAKQGEVAMVASLSDTYKLELASDVPSNGLPRATFRFPLGEVTLEEKDEEVKSVLSINGILKGQVLNGVCTARYNDDDLNLRYSYKDEKMTFIPSISLPSNMVSFAFKRRFSPSDKLRRQLLLLLLPLSAVDVSDKGNIGDTSSGGLIRDLDGVIRRSFRLDGFRSINEASYWYHFNSNEWSTVYKHTVGRDLKLKAGYDSEVRLGWASLWVGDEDGKAKVAPMKMKVQVMLQVPQDDIASSVFLFRVKKRWDLF